MAIHQNYLGVERAKHQCAPQLGCTLKAYVQGKKAVTKDHVVNGSINVKCSR